jgi:hypothetical protein
LYSNERNTPVKIPYPVLLKIPTWSHTLEVFGEPENAWFGFRLTHNTTGIWDQSEGYGSFHSAVRDGLNDAAAIEDEGFPDFPAVGVSGMK